MISDIYQRFVSKHRIHMFCLKCDKMSYHFRIVNKNDINHHYEVFTCYYCSSRSRAAMVDNFFHCKIYIITFSEYVEIRAEYKSGPDSNDIKSDVFEKLYLYRLSWNTSSREEIQISHDLHWKELPKLKEMMQNYQIL